MRATALVVAAAALAACKSDRPAGPPPYDYGPYRAHMPRSILVLPPLDDTPEVDASYSFLTTVTRPLAERGYYVFPVAVVDEFMRDNGCPTPFDMHQVPPAKLGEVFGADAVMYVTVKKWGTVYAVLNSSTNVVVDARLVDVKSGEQIWSGSGAASHDSSSGFGGGGDPRGQLVGMLASALVSQVVSSATDPSHDVAPLAAQQLCTNPQHGMLPGPLAPGNMEEQQRRRSAAAKAATLVDGGAVKAQNAEPSKP